VTLGSKTLTDNQSTTTTFSGDIGGTGGLTKSGVGTLTLSGTNDYSGGTTISAGTLKVTGGAALSGSGAVSVTGTSTFEVAGSQTIGDLTGATGSHVVIDSGQTLTTGDTNSTSVGSVISARAP